MRKKVQVAVTAIAFVLGALALEKAIQSRGHFQRKAPESANGNLLPQVTIKNAITKTEMSTHDFRGKVLLLSFWASWCEACMEEMPTIVKLNNMLKDEGFAIVSINLDEEPEKVLPSVISQLGLTFPVFLDSKEELSKAFNVTGLPFNVIIDRNLNIVRTESGARDWTAEPVVAELRSLLKIR